MTTRAGRAFTTLHDKIRRLEEINANLLDACKYAYEAMLGLGCSVSGLNKLMEAITKAEGK